jgi:hypothetical protein
METLEIRIEGGVKEIVAGGGLVAEVVARGEAAGEGRALVVGWERPGSGGEVVWEGGAGGRSARVACALPMEPTCARGELGATWYVAAQVGEVEQRAYFRLAPPREARSGAVARRDVAAVLAPEGDDADMLSLGVYGALGAAGVGELAFWRGLSEGSARCLAQALVAMGQEMERSSEE